MNLYKHPKLLEAFDLYVREQDDLLPSEEELASISFSEEFLQRMRRMIARRKWGYFALFGTAGRRAASIVVALLVASTITTVSVEALREPVSRFFTEVFEKFTMIFVDAEPPVEPTEEMELHTPTYVPDEYEVAQEMTIDSLYRVVYVDNKMDKINYVQRWSSDINYTVDTEGTEHSEIMVGKYPGFIYTNKGVVTITFWDDAYNYTLSGGISEEELIKIAKSIIK